jgi:hypothetical protein
MATALLARTERLLADDGRAPLTESSVEVGGSGDVMGREADDTATEVVVKIGVRHDDKAALEVFSREFVSFALVAQGMTGVYAGRPRVAPAIAVHNVLVDKSLAPVRVLLGDDEQEIAVEIAPGDPAARTSTEELSEDVPSVPDDAVTVPLINVDVGRSGDKGDLANIGLVARRPEFAAVLREQVTAARVAEFFAHLHPGRVRRWDVPGLDGINIVIDDVLGGRGGTTTLRFDPQGKGYAAMLLTMPVQVPQGALS